MRRNKAKSSIHMRIFGAFLVTYVLLMTGFCAFLVSIEKEAAGNEFAAYSLQTGNRVEEALNGKLDSNNDITDITGLRREFIRMPLTDMLPGVEAAIFTDNFELVYNTNDYIRCAYTRNREKNEPYDGYGLLNLREWFSDEEVKELIDYMIAEPEAKKTGDVSGYSLHIDGWLDGEMIIPDKIHVDAAYADKFDAEGNVIVSKGTISYGNVYSSGYEDTRGLPYIENGLVRDDYNKFLNVETQNEIRRMVMNELRLKSYVNRAIGTAYTAERVRMLTYRYYRVIPYHIITEIQDGVIYDAYRTAVGMDVNLWERINSTMAYVSVSCLIMFIFVAYILSKQTYKIYLQQEELSTKRKEMTDALAHDLKTPLGIISGYAQNLQDNVHTEKREHYAEHILSNIHRMDGIIKKMLEMSKLSSDSFEINIEDVSLIDISKKIISRYKNICDEKHIRVSSDGEAVIKADKALLERVVDNFFVNALDNMGDGGIIRISIQNNMLEIYNSGSHISEDFIDDIWLPYKKGNADRGNTKGSGIGLSIVRTILELHKFPHGVKNEKDGVIFWFKFN